MPGNKFGAKLFESLSSSRNQNERLCAGRELNCELAPEAGRCARNENDTAVDRSLHGLIVAPVVPPNHFSKA